MLATAEVGSPSIQAGTPVTFFYIKKKSINKDAGLQAKYGGISYDCNSALCKLNVYAKWQKPGVSKLSVANS